MITVFQIQNEHIMKILKLKLKNILKHLSCSNQFVIYDQKQIKKKNQSVSIIWKLN